MKKKQSKRNETKQNKHIKIEKEGKMLLDCHHLKNNYNFIAIEISKAQFHSRVECQWVCTPFQHLHDFLLRCFDSTIFFSIN